LGDFGGASISSGALRIRDQGLRKIPGRLKFFLFAPIRELGRRVAWVLHVAYPLSLRVMGPLGRDVQNDTNGSGADARDQGLRKILARDVQNDQQQRQMLITNLEWRAGNYIYG
jgi:hypothetical protein